MSSQWNAIGPSDTGEESSRSTAPLLSYERGGFRVIVEPPPGTPFLTGGDGGRTVPLLVVMGRRRVWSPPSFLLT